MKKLPNKCSSLAFAFYMATIIAFMMCVLLTAINTGVDGHFLRRVLGTYVVAMPVAFTCVVFVRPLVLFLVAMTVDANSESESEQNRGHLRSFQAALGVGRCVGYQRLKFRTSCPLSTAHRTCSRWLAPRRDQRA